jgi:chromosome partitioning protein
MTHAEGTPREEVVPSVPGPTSVPGDEAVSAPPEPVVPPEGGLRRPAHAARDLPGAADLQAPAPDRADRQPRPLPRLIAVANQKGGVGKTTTTVNLGASLALFGYRVLVVDLDPQGNATTGLGVDARGFQHSMYDVLLNDMPMVDCIEPVGIENLFVAPATLDLAGVEQELFSALSRELRLKRALATVVDDYDFIFVDCPPSLGLITINAFAAATEILVPVQCEFYALEGLTQLQRIVSLVQRNLNEALEITTVVLTMYDARTRLSEDVANEVRRHFPGQVQGTVIPRTVRLSEAPSFGQPITTFDPASKGARAYKALAREVSDGAQKRAR